jgi:hypothetical protein
MIKENSFLIICLVVSAVILVSVVGYLTGFVSLNQGFQVWMCGITLTPDPIPNDTLNVDAADVLNLDIDASASFPVENTNPPSTTILYSDDTDLFDIDSNGVINFQPLVGDIGTHTITITMTEQSDICYPKSRSFVLTIIGTPPAPPPGKGARCRPSEICGECVANLQYCNDGCGKTYRKPCISEGGCESNDDCPEDYECEDRFCVFKGECLTDDNCDEGYVCVDHVCEPVPEIIEIPEPPRKHYLNPDIVLPLSEEERIKKGFRLRIREIIYIKILNLEYEPIITPLAAIIKEAGPVTKSFVGAINFLFLLLVFLLLIKRRKPEEKEPPLPPPPTS